MHCIQVVYIIYSMDYNIYCVMFYCIEYNNIIIIKSISNLFNNNPLIYIKKINKILHSLESIKNKFSQKKTALVNRRFVCYNLYESGGLYVCRPFQLSFGLIL